MSAWRQNSEIWFKSWSFFIAARCSALGDLGGQRPLPPDVYHHLPT
jgi:hypothetical protein